MYPVLSQMELRDESPHEEGIRVAGKIEGFKQYQKQDQLQNDPHECIDQEGVEGHDILGSPVISKEDQSGADNLEDMLPDLYPYRDDRVKVRMLLP